MKRNPRKLKWTKAYRKLAGKELAQDQVFELERKRNRPEKYNRETVHRTIKAMDRISEWLCRFSQVWERRQDRFHAARMAKGRAQLQASQQAELQNEVHLVQAPQALLKQPEQQAAREKLRIPVEQPQQQAVQMVE
ncbi:ATPase-activating ribosome biosynthesis protein [Pseudocyphellaria aurata]|nr:ATPase-activating ribosome biosynthesis protein [Pseudocyphellaria aurata]